MRMPRSSAERRWKVRTGAALAGPPLVADGMVFGSSSDHWVYAVDAATGTVAWRWQCWDSPPAPIALRPAQRIAYGGGAVYLGGPSTEAGPGTVLALDGRSGEPRWRRDHGSESTFDVAAGAGTIIACGTGELRCLDAGDGTTRWRYRHPDLPGTVSYREPMVADGVVVVVIGVWDRFREIYNVLVAVAESDGSLLWESSVEGPSVRPAIADGVLYLGSGVGLVAAVAMSTGDLLWGGHFEAAATDTVSKVLLHPGRVIPTPVVVSNTPVSAAASRPVVAGDNVYVGSRNGYTYKLNRANGKWRWRWETTTPVTAVGHADGRVYAGFVDGTLSVFPDTGESYLWATSSPVGHVSGMTIVDGVIYVSGDPYLAAFDAATGDGPWRWPRLRTVRRTE